MLAHRGNWFGYPKNILLPAQFYILLFMNMEPYYEFEISIGEDMKDILVAELSEIGFEGFVENETGFSAFILKPQFDHDAFHALLDQYRVLPDDVKQTTVEQQNWNATWEKNFEPII